MTALLIAALGCAVLVLVVFAAVQRMNLSDLRKDYALVQLDVVKHCLYIQTLFDEGVIRAEGNERVREAVVHDLMRYENVGSTTNRR
jgi:hypothetical protein